MQQSCCSAAREGQERGRVGAAAAPGDAPDASPAPSSIPGSTRGHCGIWATPASAAAGVPSPIPARGRLGGCGSSGSGPRPGPVPGPAGLGTGGCRRARPGPPARDGAAIPRLPPRRGGPAGATETRNTHPEPGLSLPSLPVRFNSPRRADDFSENALPCKTSAINAFETIYDFRPTSTCISIYLVSLIYTLFFQNHKHSCWNFMWKCLRG